MRTITVHLPDEYIEALQNLVVSGAVPSLSEAIRLAVRDYISAEHRLLSVLGASPRGDGDGEEPEARPPPKVTHSFDRVIEVMKQQGYTYIYVHRARGRGVPPNLLAWRVNGDGGAEPYAVLLSSRYREVGGEEKRAFLELARRIGAKPLMVRYVSDPGRRGPRRIVLQDVEQDVCVQGRQGLQDVLQGGAEG